MRIRKWFGLLVVLALVAAACGDDDTTTTEDTTDSTEAPVSTEASGLQTLTPGVLTVGSDIPFPPFEDFDADGNVVGFDAELIEEMAARMGLEVVWIDTDFDTIFTQLATGAFDMVASATTITPERAEQVNFTDTYYLAQQALTINEDVTPGILSTADLGEGDSVAVQTGTTGAAWAIENLAPNGVEVREFPAAPDTYNALEGGQVTGVIFDEPSAVEESANRPGLKVVEVINTDENYGFGVDPANGKLLAAANDALQGMLDDGTYQAIYDKWFTAPAGSVLYVAMDPRADWPESVVLGFVPSQEVEELQDNVDTLATLLSEKLGINVVGLVTTDYTGLGVAMGTGEADFGAFGATGFVITAENFPNVVLIGQSVRFGSSTYHGQWMTNDPSICDSDPVPGAFENIDGVPTLLGPTETVALQVGYNGDGTRDEAVSEPFACTANLADVVPGRTIAFTNETSGSGYLAPTIQLRELGITEDQYEFVFAGGHDSVVTALVNGDADIGITFDDARRTIRDVVPTVGEDLVVFTITPEITNDVIAARDELPASLKAAMIQALVELVDEQPDLMDQLYSWTDIKPAAEVDQSTIDAWAAIVAAFGEDI